MTGRDARGTAHPHCQRADRYRPLQVGDLVRTSTTDTLGALAVVESIDEAHDAVGVRQISGGQSSGWPARMVHRAICHRCMRTAVAYLPRLTGPRPICERCAEKTPEAVYPGVTSDE